MSQQAHVLDGYMTPDELATQLDVALITLAKWRTQRKGPPFIKAGRNNVLYSRAAVSKWLENLATKPQF